MPMSGLYSTSAAVMGLLLLFEGGKVELPNKLNLSGDSQQVRVQIDAPVDLPGSNGSLQISLASVTDTTATVSLLQASADKRAIIQPTPLKPGETLRVRLVDQEFGLRLDPWSGKPGNTEPIAFSVIVGQALETNKIEALLRIISKSDVLFIRNNSEHRGPQAASHLRRKLEYVGKDTMTLEDFIDKIASKSSRSDKPYQIKLPTGEVMEASVWMRQLVQSQLAPVFDARKDPKSP